MTKGALSSARVDQNWRAISNGLARARVRASGKKVAGAFVVIAALVVAIAGAWVRRPQTDLAIRGAVIQTEEGESEVVRLPDGSRLTLGSASRLSLVDVEALKVRLELEQGSVDLDVTHVAGRTFKIAAGGVDVDVVGTRFRIEKGATASDVQVSVTEGRVRVTSHNDTDHPRFLSAGEVWSSVNVAPSSSVAATTSASSVVVRAPLRATKPSLPQKFSDAYRDGHYADAYSVVADDFSTRCTTLPANDLFRLGTVARMAGHPRDAATAFDALRTRFRDDSRAPLAALELGRIELDALEEPRAAKAALDDAIALQPEGSFREDAEARRVEALEQIGDRAECAAARDHYLEKYSEGLHRASVARRCR